MELKKYKLGEIAEIVNGATPSTSCEDNYDGEIVWITPKDLSDQKTKYIECGSRNITQKGFNSCSVQIIPAYNILMSSRAPIGLLAINKTECCTNQGFKNIVIDRSICDVDFLYYYLKYHIKEVEVLGSGTTFKEVSKASLQQFEITIPSLDAQKHIASVLADIDQKIALNRAINDNLEAMAKQLYDYWFVQFDFPNEDGKPYKSSGGKMVWNEKLKREIPEGWTCGTLLDIAHYTNGLACQKFRPINESRLPVIKIKEMHDGISSETEYVKSDIPEAVKVYNGDVLFSWSASLEVMLWAYGNGGLNQHIFKVTSNNGYPRSFYFYQLLDYVGNFKRMAEARKTTMGHITQDHLKQSTIALPPNTEIANELEKMIYPIFDNIIKNYQEITTLAKQRDELLPLLMNGQVSVNYHLYFNNIFNSSYIKQNLKQNYMKDLFLNAVTNKLICILDTEKTNLVSEIIKNELSNYEINELTSDIEIIKRENSNLVSIFISAKRIEGCSEKTISYYQSSIEKLLIAIPKEICDITTNDIRCYLAKQQDTKHLSKVTIDNLRRIFSSFFSWLEDEDYITKSPVRRIHKVRTDTLVKEVLSDESMEVLRDNCNEIRDIAMIDLLASTGIRVGELVKMNREDIDFQERQCIVFGKGNKEREVYFNARTKIHLKRYLEKRNDDNPALFVSLSSPHTRLTISGVESRLRLLGKRANIIKVHPHKFRRTLATMAIDKGMPIEQVQKLLGHVKIDTTLHYAMVNQTNVKLAHRKYLG